jgi:glycogen operon protein
MGSFHLEKGKAHPIGATCHSQGVNFSVYSKHAETVILHFFSDENAIEPSHSFILDPRCHKHGHYWCTYIQGVSSGQLYGFEVESASLSERSKGKVLLDPYSKAITRGENYRRTRAMQKGGNLDSCLKSVVVDHGDFDWQGVQAPNHPLSKTVIYEMHPKGFTGSKTSLLPTKNLGTFSGIIEKIPYLKSLGITAIELMPIQYFDQDDAPVGKQNYWGYSPINFFALHSDYSVQKTPIAAIHEFKTLVRELHKADIEVILDVVFNHTAEGDENGPVFCFKGWQNDTYYLLNEKGQYANYSGCGNTCNANDSVLRRMIIDALHYWVTEMHVDGFRFDLASVLSRDRDGHPMKEPPLLWSIDSDPILSQTKIIAEAWDAAGLYQVGNFFGDRWTEWNGQYRDDVRSFWRGDNDSVYAFSQRLLGSPDLYGDQNHTPQRSVNFICAHDGFTLNDVVSYKEKHNLNNGEENRDGENHNLSANYGIEGTTNIVDIEAVRARQCKNLLVTLFFSLGTPMMLMGDEVRRTQKGNNNAYCQDNDISWFDWSLVQKHPELWHFVQKLGQIKREPWRDLEGHTLDLNEMLKRMGVEWHGIAPNAPDWSGHSHSVMMTVNNHPVSGETLCFIFNAYWDPLMFHLPETPLPKMAWHIWIDTAQSSPLDLCDLNKALPVLKPKSHFVHSRSVQVLVAKNKE